MGRGVSSGGGQSSLGYLFGGGEAPTPPVPKPTNTTSETPQSSRLPVTNEPVAEVSKQIPAGVPAKPNTTNNYFRADGQNCGNFLTDRPTTKVHAAPGGGSSLDFLFGGAGGGK
uniref:SP1L4 n=1 Tax=Salix matsudana TaxID=349989 RepID=A0A167V9D9_9ROSI|nr:SP1L4 [Salix matsudana]QEH62722.1 SRP1 [Salix matsudana]